MEDFKTDAALAANGDTEAFARLYSAIYKDLYHIALYCLGNTHDACDAVSDTVVDAFTSIGKLRNENAFRQWIMKILSAKIKRKQREYINNKSVEYDESCGLTDDFCFESAELQEALGTLDTESRNILSMSAIGGYTTKEIADICKINPSTVRSKLSRIKEKLKVILA